MFNGKIYADFLQHCQQVPLPSPWGQFAKHADFWQPPKDTLAAMEALQQEYTRKDLLRSRVAIYDLADEHDWQGEIPAGTKLTVNPILSGPFSRILPLRASPQCLPSDLLTGEGTVSGRLPACAVLHDYLVQKWIQRTGILCLVFSMEDMMAFRAVGIPAALAKGLEQITRKSLKDLCSSLGLESPDSSVHVSGGLNAAPAAATMPLPENPVEEEQVPSPSNLSGSMAGTDSPTATRPRLFLVAWSPSHRSLNRPGDLDEVLHNLISAGRCLEIDLDDAFVWRPSETDLQRIVFCLTKGNRRHVRKAIEASLRSNAKLINQAQVNVEEPSTLPETRARLREALLRPGGKPGERRRWLRRHQQAIDDIFVTPFLEQAIAEPDPQKRSQLAGLAGINQVVYPAVEVYLAKREKELARRGLNADGQGTDVRDLMKMFDILFKFIQASEGS